MRHGLESTGASDPGTSIATLIAEIARYLEAVTLFRELGSEPSWRTEAHPSWIVLSERRHLEPCEQRVSGA